MSLRNAIFPIVKVSGTGEILSLAGTGFLIAPDSVLVTAKHVFANEQLAGAEYFAIGYRRGATLQLAAVRQWEGSLRHDLAVVREHEVELQTPALELSGDEELYGWSVLCEDFSNTEFRISADGRQRPVFSPLIQKGNVVGPLLPDRIGDSADKLLTSFPALQGASGAPLVYDMSYDVCGMMVANYERHLLPAQIVRIQGEPEEVRYFMPFGVALSLSAIVEALTDLGVSFTQRASVSG